MTYDFYTIVREVRRSEFVVRGPHIWCHSLPKRDGSTMAAGPGPWNSAAMGPRRFVGVKFPLWPPMTKWWRDDHWKQRKRESLTGVVIRVPIQQHAPSACHKS